VFKSLSVDSILHGDRKSIFRVAFVLLILTGCKPLIETPNAYISRQEAIDAALEIASASSPEMSGAKEKPVNTSAEQMTLDQAVKKIDKHNQPATGYDPNMTVWFVTMQGLWLGQMSAPGIVSTPEQVPYRHYAIIIDAKTGSEIESSFSP